MCKCHGTRAITWPTLRTEVWVGGSCEMEGEDGVEGGLGPGQAPSGVCGYVCCKDQFGCHVAQKDLQS